MQNIIYIYIFLNDSKLFMHNVYIMKCINGNAEKLIKKWIRLKKAIYNILLLFFFTKVTVSHVDVLYSGLIKSGTVTQFKILVLIQMIIIQ